MDHFYDGQVKRYLAQFMRIMSNFSYKDAKGQLTRVPVRYGDMNRQVANIIKKNSENTIPSAPFMACYIKDLQFDRMRLQDPTFISKINIRERAVTEDGSTYLHTQGSNYTVERIMPTPYLADFAVDIWTTNTDQKLQIWEQLVVLFNPSLELQTTDNYIDWTSISVLTLKSQTWSSRTIPQGVEQDIDILNLVFETHVWITPPAKVKKLGIITKIITSAFVPEQGVIATDYINPDAVLESLGSEVLATIVTPGNYDLLVLNNIGKLVLNNDRADIVDIPVGGEESSWYRILDLYPGTFRAGLSQIRLMKADGNEIVAYISLDPMDEKRMVLNFDPDTIPTNTIISGRGTVDAIVNPETFNPSSKVVGTRYLILEDVNVNGDYGTPGYDGPDAWKNADSSDPQLYANDIIEWDGSEWQTLFSSSAATDIVYITNAYTGVQYKWVPSEQSWSKSFEGIYDKALWRLVL
jgi:hypothetical protein